MTAIVRTRRDLTAAVVLEGKDRTTAAESRGMDRKTLRDWVHRYNAEGKAGIANRRAPARRRRLGPDQMAELAAWVEADPDRPSAPSPPGIAHAGRSGLDHLDPRDGTRRDVQLAVHFAVHSNTSGAGRTHRLASSRQSCEEGIGIALTVQLAKLIDRIVVRKPEDGPRSRSRATSSACWWAPTRSGPTPTVPRSVR